ncbi:MAG: molybdopterin-dependent oxidoreductase, partial [Gemmatimonadota bacterium]
FTCTLDCGSRCELVACVEDGRLRRLDTPPGRPDTPERPRLVPCVRGRAHRRLQDAPERLRQPLRRTGERGFDAFEPVSWDEALDEVAARLAEVRQRYGTAAVLQATGAGSVGGRGFSGGAAAVRFFSFWGPVTGTFGNASYHCSQVAAEWMLGGAVPASDRAALLDARLIILWGMNPAETWMTQNTPHFLAEARDRGARIVLIDPRYTDSAVLADQWIPIRPGTDAALAAALGYQLEAEGLVDTGFLGSHTTGYEAYRSYLLGAADGTPKTPAWAAAITGIPADDIRRLARDFGSSKPACLLPGWGPQRTRFGEQIARAWIALACMTGSVGVRGGGLASTGTRPGGIPGGALPRGPHAPGRFVSAAAWAAPILEGRLDPPLRMACIAASNLINRSPDTRANARALAALDYVVVVDPFFTPTARHADLVLPTCSDLERADLVGPWGNDTFLFHSHQALEPAGQTRTDFRIFAELARRLGFGDAYTGGKSEAEWLQQFLGAAHLDRQALAAGLMRTDGPIRVGLADFRRDPAAHPLPTPSGRIELDNPQAAAVGLPTVPAYVADDGADAHHPLHLITPHSKLRANSCVHANPWLQEVDVHRAWLNPEDAAARGIADGDPVEVYNGRGTIALPAKVTPRIAPGVVCVYQGTWHRPRADGIDAGGCANTLTDHRLSPTGGFTTHSSRAQVRRVP